MSQTSSFGQLIFELSVAQMIRYSFLKKYDSNNFIKENIKILLEFGKAYISDIIHAKLAFSWAQTKYISCTHARVLLFSLYNIRLTLFSRQIK